MSTNPRPSGDDLAREIWLTLDRMVKRLEERCELYEAHKRIHDSVWEIRDALEGYETWCLPERRAAGGEG